MIDLNPGPSLLVAIPCLLFAIYVTNRGLKRGEFRAPYRSGWVRRETLSPGWWAFTAGNFLFLGTGVFFLYLSLFHGSDPEPELPMPALTGTLIASERSSRNPHDVADCLARGDSRNLYALGPNSWVYAARNGRNVVMYTFEIVPDGAGSRVDVRRSLMSPFVRWDQCVP
jgi:hypothetical protein